MSDYQTSYFYVSQAEVAQGSVFPKGYLSTRLAHLEKEQIMLELFLEAYRAKKFPQSPSRLEANILFKTEGGAKNFAKQLKINPAFIYQVEVTDHKSKPHLCVSQSTTNLECMEPAAQKYWEPPAKGVTDYHYDHIVTASSARVQSLKTRYFYTAKTTS